MFLQRANPHTYSCGVGTPLAFQEEGPSKLRGASPKTGIPPTVKVRGVIAAPGTASIMFGSGMCNSSPPHTPNFLLTHFGWLLCSMTDPSPSFKKGSLRILRTASNNLPQNTSNHKLLNFLQMLTLEVCLWA